MEDDKNSVVSTKPLFYNSDELNNPLNIPSLSDEEALRAYHHFQSLTTWEQKVEFVYETTGFDSLFYIAIRIINDQHYEFGIKRNSENVGSLGQFTFEILRRQIFNDLVADFLHTSEKYTDEERQLAIASEHINWIENRRAQCKPAFDNNVRKYGYFEREWYIGYQSEALGIQPFFEVDNFNKRIVSIIANGAACYEFRYGLEALVKEYHAEKGKGNAEPLNSHLTGDTLESIFAKPEYYQKCLSLLAEYDIHRLGPRSGAGVLFGIIAALTIKGQHLLMPRINGAWTSQLLLKVFNAHLNTDFGGKKQEIDITGSRAKKVKTEVEAVIAKL